MRILVYDIAAEDGGGLYVLNQFYNELMEETKKSISFAKDIEWFILTSLGTFSGYDNIHVLSYPEIKQSTKNRLLFDIFKIKSILKEIKPDYIISLQNNPVVGTKIPQLVYLHQSLQFCPKRYSFFHRDERGTAIRQHIICEIYKLTLPKARHIFVQTKWMRDATVKWLHCDSDRVSVVPMRLPTISNSENTADEGKSKIEVTQFFYPARPEPYKNHAVILEACKQLQKRGLTAFQVIFTITGDENEYAKRIAEQAENLPIVLMGSVCYEKMWDYYRNSVLLFPSFMETIGLPMLEAKVVGSRVIASDLPFSHENLDDYPLAKFFPYSDSERLFQLMCVAIQEQQAKTSSEDTITCHYAGQKWASDDSQRNSNIMRNMLNQILNLDSSKKLS